MAHNLFNSLKDFKLRSGKTGKYYSLAALEEAGLGKTSRMPVSLRVVLESVLRNYDGLRITEEAVKSLAGWKPNAPRTQELPAMSCSMMRASTNGNSWVRGALGFHPARAFTASSVIRRPS